LRREKFPPRIQFFRIYICINGMYLLKRRI
jgi:hypothetical protein